MGAAHASAAHEHVLTAARRVDKDRDGTAVGSKPRPSAPLSGSMTDTGSVCEALGLVNVMSHVLISCPERGRNSGLL